MNELGELRPSQLIFTFGVGSLVDLPNMSALIMGLDDWDTRYCKEVEEDRLVAAVQKRLGAQVRTLYLPPIKLDSMDSNPAAPAIGVPVVPFPRCRDKQGMVDGARGAVGYGAEKTGLRPRGAGDEGERDKHERQNGKRSFRRSAAL